MQDIVIELPGWVSISDRSLKKKSEIVVNLIESERRRLGRSYMDFIFVDHEEIIKKIGKKQCVMVMKILERYKAIEIKNHGQSTMTGKRFSNGYRILFYNDINDGH